MSEPQSIEEYNAKGNANTSFFGQGIFEAGVSVPCPFCAEPGFRSYRIIDVQKASKQEIICKHCGRGAKFIFEASEDTKDGNMVKVELVQTCGPDPAPWLPIRRESNINKGN